MDHRVDFVLEAAGGHFAEDGSDIGHAGWIGVSLRSSPHHRAISTTSPFLIFISITIFTISRPVLKV